MDALSLEMALLPEDGFPGLPLPQDWYERDVLPTSPERLLLGPIDFTLSELKEFCLTEKGMPKYWPC
ncbi:hypothetical protein [Pelagimonas phthalicica]|uniref:hypothetical protein n=1 Tax=Pelagimonas phthalicica TaxID=1037362 RepID=UPI00105D1CA4|nr:hypothetical protein [Pelagimonas phthalicica]